MPQLELIDQTWIAVPAELAARLIAEPGRQRTWWPDAPLLVSEDRGLLGIRWVIADGAPVRGSVEIWLQADSDGVVLNYFVRADRVGGPWSPRALTRERRRLEHRAKITFWAIKDELEAAADHQVGRVT